MLRQVFALVWGDIFASRALFSMAKPLVEVQANGFEKFIMNRLKMKEIDAIEESSFKSSDNKIFFIKSICYARYFNVQN